MRIQGGRYELLGEIAEQETIAAGREIRELGRLSKLYGKGNWRKRKGVARVRVGDIVFRAEVHWYEAHGIGKVDFKIKRRLV